jgi:hypothetical protein
MANEKLIKAVDDLLDLIEEGVLVRDISHDDDFSYYTKQALRIVNVLSDVTKEIKEAKGEPA